MKNRESVIVGWIEVGNNTSDSRVHKTSDELRCYLASDLSRDLINPGERSWILSIVYVSFP